MKKIYLLALGLIPLAAHMTSGSAETRDNNSRKKPQEQGMLRELQDLLETQEPAIATRDREDIEFASRLTREPLDKNVAEGEECNGIVRYSVSRDKEHIINLFRDNWYWMVADGASFDPEEFLNTGDKHLLGHNKKDAKIFVYCIHGVPVAFIAYYKAAPYAGKIRFVGNNKTDPNYLYVTLLVKFALDDMKKMGLRSAELVTRTNNIFDLSLYKELGFQKNRAFEDDGEGKYVDLIKFFPFIKKRAFTR